MNTVLNTATAELTDLFLDVSEESFVYHRKNVAVTLSAHLIADVVEVERIGLGGSGLHRGLKKDSTIEADERLDPPEKGGVTGLIKGIIGMTSISYVIKHIDNLVADKQSEILTLHRRKRGLIQQCRI